MVITDLRPGVLGRKQLIALAGQGVIQGSPDPESAAGPSAFDLTLSRQCFRIRGTIKGIWDKHYLEVISDRDCIESEIDLSKPTILRPGNTYIVLLNEYLDLDMYPFLHGYASGKSSIGRLDVLVRLVADFSPAYDEIPSKSKSGHSRILLYAEVTPISFPIRVVAGISLNQLRLFQGQDIVSEITPEALKLFPEFLVGTKRYTVPDKLTVNLKPVKNEQDTAFGIVAYKAQEKVRRSVDLTSSSQQPPDHFWERVSPDENHVDMLEIIPERFYILRSRERFRLPLDVAAVVHAMSETIGELRIHYAGFIHPGFGRKRSEGTPLIFEVRGHNATTLLRHGERMAIIRYFRMSEPAQITDPESEHSYQQQELTLSRHFEPFSSQLSFL